MFRIVTLCIALLLAAGAAAREKTSDEGDKLLQGMSIVGNDDAPKSLVIVPWKSSALGHSLDVSRDLDAGRQPVDRDVFMRELEYYQIGVESHTGPGSRDQ